MVLLCCLLLKIIIMIRRRRRRMRKQSPSVLFSKTWEVAKDRMVEKLVMKKTYILTQLIQVALEGWNDSDRLKPVRKLESEIFYQSMIPTLKNLKRATSLEYPNWKDCLIKYMTRVLRARYFQWSVPVLVSLYPDSKITTGASRGFILWDRITKSKTE